MPDLLDALLADLAAESGDLDTLVAGLGPAGWRTPTPATGWTVAHQLAHLAWTDDIALLAVREPGRFSAWRTEIADATDVSTVVDREAERLVATAGDELLHRWRDGRTALAGALRAAPAGSRLPWFGPPMSPASMATARLMETWAHGLDVADAIGGRPAPTGRLLHIARLAVRTRDFSFGRLGRPAPTEEFRVELTAPDGDTWAFGPPDAGQLVTGPALDLCLLAVRRVHRADTALVATGQDADAWLDVVQAFAGPSGDGRPARGST
jgi:uncharacterized protein (TIGR03084 family)